MKNTYFIEIKFSLQISHSESVGKQDLRPRFSIDIISVVPVHICHLTWSSLYLRSQRRSNIMFIVSLDMVSEYYGLR